MHGTQLSNTAGSETTESARSSAQKTLQSSQATTSTASTVRGLFLHPPLSSSLSLRRIYPAFQQYAVFPSAKDHLVLKNEEKIPWSYYVGAAGMPGTSPPPSPPVANRADRAPQA